MPLTNFHDVRFPLPIREGLRIRLRCLTTVHQTKSGVEQRRCDWFDPIWEMDVEPLVTNQYDFDLLVNFWRARAGASFRMQNPLDHLASNVHFGTGDGTTTAFQLFQTYTSGLAGDTYTAKRAVHLPSEITNVFVGGALTTAYTYNSTTGVLTFTSAPPNTFDVHWSGTFDTPMRFVAVEMPTSLPEAGRFTATFQLQEDRATGSLELGVAEETLPLTTTARLPLDMAEGSSFGPLHRILVLTGDNEVAERSDVNDTSKAAHSVSYEAQPLRDMQQIMRFFYARRGRYASFQMRDPSDHFSNGAVNLGTGDGIATVFNFRNAYTSGSNTIYRRIYRPIQSTAHIYLNGVEQFSGFTVSYSAGTIVFISPVSLGVAVAAEFEYDDLVRFDSDTLEMIYDSVDLLSIAAIEVISVAQENLGLVVVDGSQGRAVQPAYGCGVVATAPAARVPRAARFDLDGISLTIPTTYSQDPGMPWQYFSVNGTPLQTLSALGGVTVAVVISRFKSGVFFDIGGPEYSGSTQWGGVSIPLVRFGVAGAADGALVYGDAGESVPTGASSSYSVFGRSGSGSLAPNISDPCDPELVNVTWDDPISSDCLAVIPAKAGLDGLGTQDGSGFIQDVCVLICSISLWTKKFYLSGSLNGVRVLTMNPNGGQPWFVEWHIETVGGCRVATPFPIGTWPFINGGEPYLRKTWWIGGAPSISTIFDYSMPFDLHEAMVFTHNATLASAEPYWSQLHQVLCGYFYRKYALGVSSGLAIPGIYSWLDVADVNVDVGDGIDDWPARDGVSGAPVIIGSSGLNFRPSMQAKSQNPTLPAGKTLTTFDGITPYSIQVATELST